MKILFSKTCIAAAVALLCAGGPSSATAQTMEEIRAELKLLRDEVAALKKQNASMLPPPVLAASKPLSEQPLAARVEALEAKSTQMVFAGEADGSLILPKSKTSLRVYGQAEVHAIHDIKQSGVPDFFTNLTFQPLNRADSQNGHSKITAESSRFGIETSTPLKVGTLNTKLEADFYAYSADTRNRLRLRQAYGEMGNWLIGKTWSTFMDLDNLPETVDFNGPIGAPFSRRAMIRYSVGDAKTGIKFSFAAEDPEDQFGGGSANERLPQLVIRMDSKFERVAVNVRALMHEKRSPTQTKHGYGVGVGANIKLTDNDVLMAQYTRVDGDIDQLYGANGYAIDATTGNISFDKNQGLVMGYAHIFDSQLRGNIAYGYNRGTSPQAADNRTLNQFFINLIYSPIKNVDIGGEFIQGKRKTFNGETGTLSRIDLMGRYSF